MYSWFGFCYKQKHLLLFTLLFNRKIEPCPPLIASSDLNYFVLKALLNQGKNSNATILSLSCTMIKLQTVSPDIHRQNAQRPKKICSVNTMVQSKISLLHSISAPGPAHTKEKVMHAPDSLDSQNVYSAPTLPSTFIATTFQTQLCEYNVASYREKAKTMNNFQIYTLIKKRF